MPAMIFALILTIIAFIIILSETDWKWVTTSEPATFAHSIFGIACICLAIIEV